MKSVIRNKINIYGINNLGFDMMGYTFDNANELSFHHLLLSKRQCKYLGLGSGCFWWNSAILKRDTSHDYIHLIEEVDPEIFYAITSEIIDQNLLRRIEIANLKNIRNMLLYFEKEHDRDISKKGEYLIKPEYIEKRISLK